MTTMINPGLIKKHSDPLPTRTKVFHIEKNGEVKRGYVYDLDEFEREAINFFFQF